MGSYFAPPTVHTVDALPLETRIVSVDPESCGDFTLSADGEEVQVTLYLLYESPTRTYLAASSSLLSTYYVSTNGDLLSDFWFYLVTGSSYELTVSVDAYPPGGTLYLQLYISLYNQHLNEYSTREMCSNVSPDTPCTKTLSVDNDGMHFVTFSFHADDTFFVNGQISGVVKRYNYEISKSNTRDSCEAPCSERIDYDYDDTILVRTSNITDLEDTIETVEYTWLCSDIRPVGIWVSFVMLVGMFLVMLSVGFIVALCVVLCIRKRTDTEDTEPLIQPYASNSSIHSGALPPPPPQYTAVSVNSLRAPPPYTEAPEPQTEGDK